jgi:hypothetical protein
MAIPNSKMLEKLSEHLLPLDQSRNFLPITKHTKLARNGIPPNQVLTREATMSVIIPFVEVKWDSVSLLVV